MKGCEKLKTNKNMLNSKMKLIGDNQSDLAAALNLSVVRTNAKINNTDGAEFTQSEIGIMISRYQLTAEEVMMTFFTDCVSCEDTTDEK